ncbi:MAG: RluA family pseudouridine synthase [Alphaproteobacteria bacterium]|nr:RluA family pseudouridine synthase [Alphaproteobacteria bacterium]
MSVTDDSAAPAETRTVRARAADKGARLDRVLAAALAPLTRTRIKRLIEAGLVSGDIGGTIRDASYRVKPGETYAIVIPPPKPARPVAQAMDLAIVHEDADLIVIDKPAGLVVHPAPGNPDRTLVNALIAHCGPGLTGIGGEARPGIVHRLDKDTSGLMVAAKTERAHASLTAQFAARTIGRTYKAVVWGAPHPQKGEIEGNIGRHKVNRKRMAVVTNGGKPALTRYRTVTTYRAHGNDFASFLDLRLGSGRTHQIRVHLAHIGHPIVGDRLYGRARGPGDLKATMAAAIDRQALHAIRLDFDHPADGRRCRFEGEVAADFAKLISLLRSLDPAR